MSRVCVKASPAFGRRRLHRNTDHIDCPALSFLFLCCVSAGLRLAFFGGWEGGPSNHKPSKTGQRFCTGWAHSTEANSDLGQFDAGQWGLFSTWAKKISFKICSARLPWGKNNRVRVCVMVLPAEAGDANTQTRLIPTFGVSAG